MRQIYLDNAATTPLDKRVLAEMMPYLTSKFGNASSLHAHGQEAHIAVDLARKRIAGFLNCAPAEVCFTSGATESDNMAIFGVVRAWQAQNTEEPPHVIVSAIEHEAVLEPVKMLAKEGAIGLSYAPVNSAGQVDIARLKKLIRPTTILVSIMLANNEIGTVQPVAELGRLIARMNVGRKHRIYLHTDATQAPGSMSCNVSRLKVHLLSLSAHKAYGPKGVGVLYVKSGTPIVPLIWGGGQERKLRSGTANVAGIVGMGKALELAASQDEALRVKALRRLCHQSLAKQIPGLKLNGSIKRRLAGNLNFTINGADGESMVRMLSQQGIMASTGAACSTGSLDASHVLLAIGLDEESAHCTLRISIGRQNKKSDIVALGKSLPPIVEKLRKMRD